MQLPTVGQAREYVGGLSNPSKMPGWGYSTPAEDCIMGSRLRKVAGSVCSVCYACKGRYQFPNVQNALKRRLNSLSKSHWVENMAKAINKSEWFRWHDSGDLQSVAHLKQIVEVAELTPETKHWLPTRENQMVTEYLRDHGPFPSNLCVRVSSAMIDGPPLAKFPNTSTVHATVDAFEYECPAHKQDNKCGDCRACWDTSVENVSYLGH